MSRQNHVRWMGVVGVALVVAVAVSTAGAAGRPRSALDEVERPHRPPEVQTIVLRFVHIPAESFVDTLEQLARNPKLRERLEQMPMAVNEPANAVVLIAPPEVAAVFARVADELDQPNEFLMHEREREVEEAATRLRLEAAKRHLAQPVPPPMAARGRGPRMEPGRGGPPSQAARPRQPLAP
ncbi:MAG: hypothetical protein U9R68_08960, partial [Planctomycetota bacterium]|nr:hypothetical protein [Planctomycetota bacterium]